MFFEIYQNCAKILYCKYICNIMLNVICHQDNLNSYGTTYNYISSFKKETKITKTTYNTLCSHGCGTKRTCIHWIKYGSQGFGEKGSWTSLTHKVFCKVMRLPVWYCSCGYMILCMCWNYRNVNYKEWTLMY